MSVQLRTEGHDYRATNPPPAYAVAQWLAFALGLIFTLAGIVGFFLPGLDGFASNRGASLLGFHVNPLHNLVHLAAGLVGLATWRTLPTARAYGLFVVVAYGAAFVYGLFAVGRDWDFLALNWADNVLHIVLALVGVAIVAGTTAAMRRRGPKIM